MCHVERGSEGNYATIQKEDPWYIVSFVSYGRLVVERFIRYDDAMRASQAFVQGW